MELEVMETGKEPIPGPDIAEGGDSKPFQRRGRRRPSETRTVSRQRCPSSLSGSLQRIGWSCRFPLPYKSGFFISVCTQLIILCFLFIGGVRARSQEYSSNGDTTDSRITCYTCMNVSSNEECNRYAIDRPCPEGKDFCLTLHVMEGMEDYKSVLVNKRCATYDDCSGDSTGCNSVYEQMQCVSCCDQPYCNDYVPINETTAIFQKSSAVGTTGRHRNAVLAWHVTIVILNVALTTVFWT